MVARLLQQIGVGLDWIDTGDLSLFDHSVASRLFYVPDAVETVDVQRRKVAFCSESVPKGVAGWFSTVTTRLMARTFFSVQAGALFRP